MAEIRGGQRFPLELPIAIEGRKAVAHTRDLSAAGVFITGAGPLKLGARLRFRITLPKGMLGVARDVKVVCDGRVVRVDSVRARARARKRMGIACVIDRYKFVKGD